MSGRSTAEQAVKTSHAARKNLGELLQVTREIDLKIKTLDIMEQSDTQSSMREIFTQTIQSEIDAGMTKEKELRGIAEKYVGLLKRAEEQQVIRLRYLLGMSNEEIRGAMFPDSRIAQDITDYRINGIMRSALDKLDIWEERRAQL